MKGKSRIYLIIILAAAVTFTGCGKLFYGFVFGANAPHYSSEADPSSDASLSSEPDTQPDTESEPEPSVESSGSTEPTIPEPPASEAPPDISVSLPFEERDEVVYTTTNLNIRTAPSTDSDVLTVLAANKSLKRTGYHSEWSRVEYNGHTAYASSEYLTTVMPALSNEVKQFGYDHNGERDEKNVPTAMYWYIRNWGNEADFLQDTEQNIIYLTMDEGYETGNTPVILDTLKEKGVKAVFFLTKGFVDECPDLVQRMIDEGHILGNHTCSHPAAGMPSLSVDEQKEDITTLHNMVLEQFGYEMKLFRFPAGIYSDQSLQVVTSLGYRSVFWSFAHRDFEINNQPDPAKALDMCIKELHPGAIYLLHAVSDTNTQILGDWIDAAREKGYEFGTYPVD